MRSLIGRVLAWPRLRDAVSVSALAALLVFVFVDQPREPGFQAGHRGWVSAHTLAIAQKASADNGFVGYTMPLVVSGTRDFFYFDRYPVFFSAALHAAIHAGPFTQSTQIYAARQVMNLIYVLTVLAAVMLLREVGLPLPAAIAAAAIGTMGHFLIEYRDMVHYDQPALLGWMVLMWAIAAWYRGAGARWVYAATAFAVLAGRGYASFAVLGVWGLVEAFDLLRMHGVGALRPIALSVPARACVLSIALAVVCLGYNVSMEAATRGVPLSDVSIVVSAERRLSLNERFNKTWEKRLSWDRFIGRQAESFVRSLQPWTRYEGLRKEDRGKLQPIAALAFLAALLFAMRQTAPRRKTLLVMILAGPVWICVMRDLTAFHGYTAMYYLPLAVALSAALLRAVPMRAHVAMAVLACALSAWGTASNNSLVEKRSRKTLKVARDMDVIAGKLSGVDEIGGYPKFRKLVPGVPFALGFYLPDKAIVVDGQTRTILSRQMHLTGENLTPDNSVLFLYSKPEGRPYRIRASIGGGKLMRERGLIGQHLHSQKYRSRTHR